MQWKDLPHGTQINEVLNTSLRPLLYNAWPEQGGLSWILSKDKHKYPDTWLKGSGALEPFIAGLSKVIRPVCDDFGRSVESTFQRKLQPRNVFLSQIFDEKISNIDMNMPIPIQTLSKDDVLDTMYHDDLGHHTGQMGSIFSVEPPSGSTSMGVIYDPILKCVITGDKKSYWSSILRKASEIIEWSVHQSYNWCNIDSLYNEVIQHCECIYVPSVRLDRGAYKIRLIWAGNAIMYAIESLISRGIKQDMRASMHLGYLPMRGRDMRDIWGNKRIISGDCKSFDLHNHQVNMKSAFMAWQEMYGLPESLMCVIYAYNTYAPIALWDLSKEEPILKLTDRKGICPSGSGAFVIINNLIMRSMMCRGLSIMLHVSITELDDNISGISFGDDHVLPVPADGSLQEWIHLMKDFGQDVSESEVQHGRFKFLRMLYGPSYERKPIVFSRFRNACCPEDSGIPSRSAELNAVALRAQLLPFAYLKKYDARYKAVYEELSRILVPKDQLLIKLSDVELARTLQFGEREMNALFFAKRVYQVEDSQKVFLE